ncbi:MAG: ATP-binding cassette domain-containing protein [Oscillospiraceae bacterium]
MLQIRQLTKKYPIPTKIFSKEKQQYKKALDEVSFDLVPGLYGLLGPNGAGKSTLINIITGGLRPSAGAVRWNDISIKKLGKKYRKILGYMPQQQSLYENFTGRQFLLYMCALKEIKSEVAVQEVERVSQRVNLNDELDKRLSAYSGGMKQRLLAASAVLGNPKILIFDEPTAGLDPKERARLRTFMKELSADAIVLTATHVVSDVENVADEILLLKDGKLIEKAPVDKLIEKYAPNGSLEQVYLNIFGEEGIH